MKTFRVTFILAGLLVGFVLYIFLVEKPREIRLTQKRQEAKKVFHVDWTKVEAIDLESDSGKVVLAREKDRWWIREPRALAADKFQVDSLLDRLKEMDQERVVDPTGKEPAAFGLDHPKVRVSFRVEGGAAPTTLALGDKTQVGYSLYARVTAAPEVFLVSASYEYSLKKKLEDLRDRKVLDFDRFSVQGVHLSSPAGEVTLAQKGGRWWIEEGADRKAGDEEVNHLLNTLSGLRAERFEKDDPARDDLKKYGLLRPTIEVTLTLERGRTLGPLDVGGRSPDLHNYYARVGTEPFVYAVRYDLAEDLSRPAVSFRDRRIFPSFLDTQVERVVVASPASPTGPISLGHDRGKDRWSLEGGKSARSRAVTQLLGDLRDAQAAGFAEGRLLPAIAYGLAPPTERVELYLEGTPAPYVLQIGKTAGKGAGFYAATRSLDTIYLVDPKLAKSLNLGLDDLSGE